MPQKVTFVVRLTPTPLVPGHPLVPSAGVVWGCPVRVILSSGSRVSWVQDSPVLSIQEWDTGVTAQLSRPTADISLGLGCPRLAHLCSCYSWVSPRLLRHHRRVQGGEGQPAGSSGPEGDGRAGPRCRAGEPEAAAAAGDPAAGRAERGELCPVDPKGGLGCRSRRERSW